jgi:flavorubredoxin
LFSSDLFGSYDVNWSLYANVFDKCDNCDSTLLCDSTDTLCHVCGVFDFHRFIMPCTKALRNALNCIEKLDISMIAPQHGSIFYTPDSVKIIIEKLKGLKSVGIDILVGEDAL